MRRKVYDKLLKWKNKRNLSLSNGILYLPLYMTALL